jgi:hypothetical protein
MSLGMDGIIWVQFKYSDGTEEYINANNITRIRDVSEADFAKLNIAYPAVNVSLVGTKGDLELSNVSAAKLKERIDKAVKTHYDNIAERALGLMT